MEAATGQEVELCLECIEWAKAEKRTFLRQALEVRVGSHQISFSPPNTHTDSHTLFFANDNRPFITEMSVWGSFSSCFLSLLYLYFSIVLILQTVNHDVATVLLCPQARLISLYFDTKCYQEALQLGRCQILRM